MSDVQITVRSLTYGQKGIRLLQNAGIRAVMHRSPKKITDTGCGYCIGVRQRDAERATDILRGGGVTVLGVWREKTDGEYERLPL